MSERARAEVAAHSELLHARVRAFARRALEPAEPARQAGGGADTFAALGLDIARFQARHGAAFSRLGRQRGSLLDTLAAVPAVPADAFRLGRVCVHAEAEDAACFFTSGTTGGAGRHAFRTL